jgi:cytochrome P450
MNQIKKVQIFHKIVNEILICYCIGLSRSEILNETVIMLLASFDTTSSGLSWFIHLMSKHSEVQQKVKEEIREKSGNQQLLLDQLDSLVYLDCVIKEVLRFAPPLFGTLRTLTNNDCLPNSGFQLYKGDTVLIPIHNIAYDPKNWSVDPERFYPERFLNEDKNHHPYAFIPFGGGHRSCIGQDLARFELKVIAARLMQYVTFSDGGPKINAGGFSESVTKPKHVGVIIHFD